MANKAILEVVFDPPVGAETSLKTGPFDYIEHPVPLFGGEFSEQESYL